MYIRRFWPLIINGLMLLPLAAQVQQSNGPTSSAAADTQAQTDPSAGHGPQRQQHRQSALAQSLNLSPDQLRQWTQIQRETMQQVRATRKDDSLNEEQMQQKLKAIHAEQRRQVIALLTPVQQETLKKWWEEQRQKQQNKGTPSAASSDSAANASEKDDDFFAGMVQDPEPPASAAAPQSPNKPAPPK